VRAAFAGRYGVHTEKVEHECVRQGFCIEGFRWRPRARKQVNDDAVRVKVRDAVR